LTPEELRRFQRAENFLWAVRCHLHVLTGRPEDRLTFDVQREVATRMRYTDRPGRSGVERFMQHYFLTAKQVGDLTGIFLAHLDEAFASRGPPLQPAAGPPPPPDRGLPARTRPPGAAFRQLLRRDPVRLIEMFAIADRHGLEIHPLAMRQAGRDARLIDNRIRADPRANALFLMSSPARAIPKPCCAG
jgi:[protein-PII] uridylyltransferase